MGTKGAALKDKFFIYRLERLRFTFTANGKRQTRVENFPE